MIVWRQGLIAQVGKSWGNGARRAVELQVELAEPLAERRHSTAASDPAGTPDENTARYSAPRTTVQALAYPAEVGVVHIGDTVMLNCTALAMGLGTGGYALVAGVIGRTIPDPPAGPGHLVKARYTPLQTIVLGADEQDSPYHALLRDADNLLGMPVVIADLHSALPAIIAGIRVGVGGSEAFRDAVESNNPVVSRHPADSGITNRNTIRIAYVMTDGGALPLAFSRTVAALRDADWLATTITTGQAYGGELEAVTLHSGLLAAQLVAKADIAIITQGPGNLGTGTKWGFSGVAAGEAVNAVGTLGGRAIGCLRISGADARPRHLGISHHSITAYNRVALLGADVPLPIPTADLEALPNWGADLTKRIMQQAMELAPRHRIVEIPVGISVYEALQNAPAKLSTMGRGLSDDPAAFVAAAAAGIHAAQLLAIGRNRTAAPEIAASVKPIGQ